MIEYAWTALTHSQRKPPGCRRKRSVRYSGEPDANALSLLRGAGLYLDQVALHTLAEDAQFEVAIGEAEPAALAEAIWQALEHDGHAMTIETRLSPVQITELPEVPSSVLVVDSEALDAVQVPIELDAIQDALEAG
jgi:hypothetical protein